MHDNVKIGDSLDRTSGQAGLIKYNEQKVTKDGRVDERSSLALIMLLS